jgi:hypothetical protein
MVTIGGLRGNVDASTGGGLHSEWSRSVARGLHRRTGILRRIKVERRFVIDDWVKVEFFSQEDSILRGQDLKQDVKARPREIGQTKSP